MNEVQYIGEHLGPRYVGHFALLLAFFAGLLSLISYWLSTYYRDEKLRGNRWQRLGQLSFLAHGAAVFTVIGTIFFAMLNQYYEYSYVHNHVSGDLQQRYIFAAFWEGQEGSFLLWMFWHVILGYVLMVTARKWEGPVMTVLASVQVIILTMILGIHFGFGDFALKLGSNPMLLMRETLDAPIFDQADYVALLKGTGLNPSLQNYWMTIHPPTLFLGFASTIVPFAFAVAGLWLGDHKGWLRPALRWSLFSGGILGIGILMGAAWAYEALNFGGYWAWDPVENTSLVPWLLIVAGIHTVLIARATGQGIKASYIFFLLGFILTIYSTFLTRSGILGDTSVHAFTEMGLESQLLFFLGFYVFMALGLLIWRWRGVPTPEKEEGTSSREFWMFIGSLVLFMSAVLITGATSLPVYNSIMEFFDPTFDGLTLEDPEQTHNNFQIYIGIFIGIISGIAHYLRWREVKFSEHSKSFLLHTLGAVAGAVVFSWLTTLWIQAPSWQHLLLLFSGWFVVWSNVDFMIQFLRKDPKAFGSSLSHIGFGLMLIGILASGTNKRIISQNQFLMEGLTAEEELERTSITLFKDLPMGMENYELTFKGDSIHGFNRTYFVDYLERDTTTGEVTQQFTLEPNILYDRKFENVAITNPSTKHYWNRDVFTVIMSMPAEEQSIKDKQAKEDSLRYVVAPLTIGDTHNFRDTVRFRSRPDTFLIRNFTASLESFAKVPDHPDYNPEPGDIGLSATVVIKRDARSEDQYRRKVALVLRDGLLYHYPAQIDDIATRVKIDESVFDLLLVKDEELTYEEFNVTPGASFTVGENTITFQAYQPDPQFPHYSPEPGDVSVAALLDATNNAGINESLAPIFVIRDKTPNQIRDMASDLGLYANLVNINTDNGEATILVAQAPPTSELKIPVAIASNSTRSDWITLQAIEFPGINFFWFGTISMMLGMLINMVIRLRSRKS